MDEICTASAIAHMKFALEDRR
eukprot:SAG31_NODE_20390_length_576_cov_0.788260_2_plen_21_part_01